MLRDISLNRSARESRPSLRPAVEALEERAVPAIVPVNADVYPYSAVVEIQVTYPSGYTYVGSGAMIDANSVLTAGHVAYSAIDGGYPTSMIIRAGYDHGGAVATASATAYYVDPRFIARENSFAPYNQDGDVAVISLDQDIGNITGTFTPERAQAQFGNMAGMTVESAGYPASGPFRGLSQYYTTGKVDGDYIVGTTHALQWTDSQLPGFLTLQYGGQSGSPMYRTVGNDRFIDAIFVSSTYPPFANASAVLITDDIYGEIMSWSQINNGDPYHTVANSVVHSSEYYTNFITNAYQSYLGRLPDANGIVGWLSQMQAGLRDEQLEASFIGSPEYIANHGGTSTAWVNGMYVDLLGRPASPEETAAWLAQLGAGISPYDVAYGFAASSEREAQRVMYNYLHYLGRPAESVDAVLAWVNQFAAGLTNEDMIVSFVTSTEYISARARTDFWINDVYLDVLNRPATANEINAWMVIFV